VFLEGAQVETAALVIIGSIVLGAASAYVLTAIGLLFLSLIVFACSFAIPAMVRPDLMTLLAGAVTMQLAYVATGWWRSG
jgi:hypothetical protein